MLTNIVNVFSRLDIFNSKKKIIPVKENNENSTNKFNFMKSFLIFTKINNPSSNEILYSKSLVEKIIHTTVSNKSNSILQTIKEVEFNSSNSNNSNNSNNSTNNSNFTKILKRDESIVPKKINIIDNNKKVDQNVFIESWNFPPKTYGLGNSERIFGQYYLTGKNLNGKIVNIDFFFTILDNIRNIRPLNIYQLEYIKTISSEKLIIIINEYNKSMNIFLESLEEIVKD